MTDEWTREDAEAVERAIDLAVEVYGEQHANSIRPETTWWVVRGDVVNRDVADLWIEGKDMTLRDACTLVVCLQLEHPEEEYRVLPLGKRRQQ